MSLLRVVPVLLLVLFLTACGTSAQKLTISIPDIVEYDDDFRNSFADELDKICGIPEEGIVDKMPKSCTFIRDTIELRARLRELQK